MSLTHSLMIVHQSERASTSDQITSNFLVNNIQLPHVHHGHGEHGGRGELGGHGGQDRTGQDTVRTGQDRTGQDKTDI